MKESIDTTSPQGRFILTLFGAITGAREKTSSPDNEKALNLSRLGARSWGNRRKNFQKNERRYTISGRMVH